MAETNQIVIRANSPELFSELIMKVPVTPEYAELTFSAKGVMLPKDNDCDDESRYIKECFEKHIIPYSEINLSYNEHVNTFTPQSRRSELIHLSEGYSTLRNIASIEGLLSGGQIHMVNLDTKRFDLAEASFQHLKEYFMCNLSNRDYQAHAGELWLSAEERRGYNSGMYANNLIRFNNKDGVELITRKDKPSDEVLGWFYALAERFEPR
jgi:hypothetical protein